MWAGKKGIPPCRSPAALVQEKKTDPNHNALTEARVPTLLQHTISVRYATEHRCGVVVRGPGLTDRIGGTDPLKDALPLLVSRAGLLRLARGHGGGKSVYGGGVAEGDVRVLQHCLG